MKKHWEKPEIKSLDIAFTGMSKDELVAKKKKYVTLLSWLIVIEFMSLASFIATNITKVASTLNAISWIIFLVVFIVFFFMNIQFKKISKQIREME